MNLAPESLPLSVTAKRLSVASWDCPGFLVRTATGAWIIDVDPENFDRDEMAEPFARLIAAAPDMLALVERVAALNPDAGEIGAGMLVQLVTEARAAKAKATGA